MIFYVSNIKGIYKFVGQKSDTKDRQTSLKMTKNAECHGATRGTKSMDITR